MLWREKLYHIVSEACTGLELSGLVFLSKGDAFVYEFPFLVVARTRFAQFLASKTCWLALVTLQEEGKHVV